MAHIGKIIAASLTTLLIVVVASVPGAKELADKPRLHIFGNPMCSW
jgi:hypothetical protein